MTPFRPKAVAALAAVVSLAGLLMGAPGQPAAAQTASGPVPGGWRVVYESTSKTSNPLYGVAAVSPGDAWAAGEIAAGGSNDQSVVLHWNGTSWKPASVPGLAGFMCRPWPRRPRLMYGCSWPPQTAAARRLCAGTGAVG